jgi:hypothetical protein
MTTPSHTIAPADTGAPGAAQACSRAEFARRQGWSKSYITKLADQGRLVLTDDGSQVVIEASLQRIAATTRAPERADAKVVPPAFTTARERKEWYDAEGARLDLEERVGLLLERGDVLSVVAEAATVIRTRLEALPDRLAPQLAALAGNEQRIRLTLAEQIEHVLAEMARRFAALEQQRGVAQ